MIPSRLNVAQTLELSGRKWWLLSVKRWITPGPKSQCDNLEDPFNEKVKNPILGPGLFNLGWCTYNERVKKNVYVAVMNWKCEDAESLQEGKTREKWESVWSVSISSHFRYMAIAPWCIIWGRNLESNRTQVPLGEKCTSSCEKTTIVPFWHCLTIYNCISIDKEIKLIPSLAAALKYRCEFRGWSSNNKLEDMWIPKRGATLNCRKTSIPSPGHLTWALSDGTWMTCFSLDGKVKQITLEMITLCSIWKKYPFKGNLEKLRIRWVKREDRDFNAHWYEPGLRLVGH